MTSAPHGFLCGVAEQKGKANTLRDIEVAAMTEIPTTRQWRADCLTATRGGGIEAEAIDIRNAMKRQTIELRPSQASEVRHAFGTVVRFFPAGLTLLSELEETLWATLYGTPESPSPTIFNDQYISTGGQFYEILSGRDRFIADLRPEAFNKLGTLATSLIVTPMMSQQHFYSKRLDASSRRQKAAPSTAHWTQRHR